jgi:RNA 2',3'-cyclic 3'-phosphodiesterase
MENDGAIRSFIAVELPGDVKSELVNLIESLKKPGFSFLRWVNPQGIHLTLKFLGNVNPEKIAEINKVIGSASARVRKFTVEIEGLGFFPNSRRPRVFWIGFTGDMNSLTRLQESIDMGTEKLGFPREKRQFSPHLTLARINEGFMPGGLADFVSSVDKLNFTRKFHIEVDSVSLMKSELMKTGARYTKLFEARLQR